MKKIFTLLLALTISSQLIAQKNAKNTTVVDPFPQKISYQAVIRNSSNVLLASAGVGMKISILQGSATGTPVYEETHTPTTNLNGLISIEIGGGAIISGSMATIDWANGPYFIKTETDPTGGTTYTITGTSQLLSVPYAIYAKTSGSSTPGPAGPKGDKGDPGTNGINGIDGLPGAKGDKGDAGTNGTDGLPGAKGDKGDAGTNGTNGADGLPGAKGDKGDTGTNGTNGTDGLPGAKGDKGDSGTNGTNGQGVPTGGTTGQVLAKVNATDYNTQWVTPSGADNLGNHTATQNLAMGGNSITGATNITATGTATLGGNTYPTTTGTNGQVLTTNGAGTLSWGSASGGGGAQLLVRVFANTPQTFVVASSFVLPAIATCMGGINTNVGGAWNAATGIFTAPSAGLYMVSVHSINLAGTSTVPVPSIDVDNNQALPLLDITGGEGDFFGDVTTQLTQVHPNPYKHRAKIQALIYLNAGQTFSLRMHSHLSTASATPSQDGTTNMTIVKLN